MNIKFTSIELSGFRSIDQAKISLDNQGIVIVKGINEYEDNATSNGSGKSSIFEGIIYALFEETSSGEKDVENRILCNGFTIKLEFIIDNINYTIYREGKKGKTSVILYKDNVDISARTKSETNKLILSILGISKSIFLDTIFLSQNAVTNLASLQPTARRERLEVLTNTDYTITLFKDKVKEQQSLYEDQCNNLQSSLSKLQGNKESLQQQLTEINYKIEEVNRQIAQRDLLGNIDSINNEIEVTNKNIEIQKDDLKNKEEEIEVIQKEITDFIQTGNEDNQLKIEQCEKINNLKKDLDNNNNSINLNNYQIEQSNNNIDKEKREIEKIKNSDTCPTCGRKYENINEEHINNIIKEHEDLINLELQKQMDYKNNNEGFYNNIKDIEFRISDEQTILNEIDNRIYLFNEELRAKENKRTLRTSEKQTINNNINVLNNHLNELQFKKDQILSFKVGNKEEFEKMQIDIQSKILDIEKEVNEINLNYNKTLDLVNTAKHMIQLITKEFRTYLLQNSLKYLNKTLENYSKQLFSNDGDVIKIEENDTKLDITLGNASYESLSGGERTRVNIALLLAQKSLAQMIGNISCNIIILDEILGYCDGQAETVVIDLITKELDSLESIYMVSHKEIPIGYDKELIIIKDKSGLSKIKNY
jgi:DNA repair exonuclease SbcCD ATPase subunit